MIKTEGEIFMPSIYVPYFSQKEDEIKHFYDLKACGLTSLRMVLAYYDRGVDMDMLADLASSAGAFTQRGWLHTGLIDIARGLGLHGYRINYDQLKNKDLHQALEVFDKEGYTVNELEYFKESFHFARKFGPIEDFKRLIGLKIPVIVSMEKSYSQTTGSHMVVITEVGEDSLTVNDPWDNGQQHLIPLDYFLVHWTNRAIVITS